MTDPVAPVLEESITIDAATDRVWALVSDLGRMSRWSPQVLKTIVRGRPIKLGTKMLNINRRGPLVWPTQTKVVRFEPQQEIAFRVKDNFTIWSFSLTDDGNGGTVLTQRREAPEGISPISRRLPTPCSAASPASRSSSGPACARRWRRSRSTRSADAAPYDPSGADLVSHSLS